MECLVPEVIVISDDESESSDNEATSTALQPFSWSEVADRLLLLAKTRELRDDQAIAAVLHDLGVLRSHDLRRALKTACEKLGDLLLFWSGHARHLKTCEGLVMKFCEVLSLVHTAPSVSGMEPQESGVKEEVVDVTSNEFAMFSLYQLMNGWKIYMTELSRFTNSRQHAITSTMERMEALIKQCSCEIGRLQDKMADCELEKENAAEEFVETLQLCRLQVEKEQGVDFLQIYNDTFNKTADVQSKFQAMVEARSWLVHRTRNMELHREVYRALHVVACTAASIRHQREDQQLTTEEQVSNRGSKMLMELDSFGAGLEAVMERSARDHQYSPGSNHTAAEREYLRFARDLEEFWLIYRNWLPHVVMDTATRIFFSLSASVNEGCPIRNAVSRVYTNLREEYPTQ